MQQALLGACFTPDQQEAKDDVMTLKNVLFLGTGNATRSIMAEAYMNHAGRGLYRAFSAGSAPVGEVNPLAIETLRNIGVRGRNLSSKSLELFAMPIAPRMDLIVWVREEVGADGHRRWPGAPVMRHWKLVDPNDAGSSGARRKAAYLECFAQLRQNIDAVLLADPPLGTLMEHAARGEVLALEP